MVLMDHLVRDALPFLFGGDAGNCVKTSQHKQCDAVLRQGPGRNAGLCVQTSQHEYAANSDMLP